MEHVIARAKGALIALAAALTAALGALAVPLCLLAGANVVDYLTGLMAAPARGQRRSRVRGLRGITKKISMWMLVLVGFFMDRLLAYAAVSMGWTPPLQAGLACLVAVWLLVNELISILENVADLGVQVPFLLPLLRWIGSRAQSAAALPQPGSDKEEGTPCRQEH